MRYYSINKLEKGMVLARSLYDERCEVVYHEGAKINGGLLEKIKKAGYPGAYVLDALSDEIVPEPFLNEDVHMNVVRAARRFVEMAESDARDDVHVTVEEQRAIVIPVIEELQARPNLMFEAIDIKPYAGYDYYHATMVMILSIAIGIRQRMNATQLYELAIAALLHDIGTVFLPPDLLNRPGRLTDEEFEMMKDHVRKGSDYLQHNFSLPASACLGALQHHENYDGTGYPGKLKRKNISSYGRIIAITDVYDALVSKRSYRAAMYPQQALDVVQQHSDRKFDPDIVEALESIVAPYPSGVQVKLKTGEECIVAKNYPDDMARPKLVPSKCKPSQRYFINLHSDPEYAKLRISKIID